MSFADKWEYPADHPIKPEQAKALIGGELGAQYRRVLSQLCSPIFWHNGQPQNGSEILSNGTVTFARIRDQTVGITAAHVVRGFELANDASPCTLQIGNAAYRLNVLGIDDDLDLAVLRLSEATLSSLGKQIMLIATEI